MYLIVGSGKVATHFAHYFAVARIDFLQWARRPRMVPSNRLAVLSRLPDNITHVLLLIQDGAIDQFIRAHAHLRSRTLVHFSGSLVSDYAVGVHPLMTFTDRLYPGDFYPTIPFILEKGAGSFARILPGLKNPHYQLERDLKPLYHALCVLSGNFTSILWSKFFKELNRLGLPDEAGYPYLERICGNLRDPTVPATTGPLVRKDYDTIRRNLKALEDDPFCEVYQAFLSALGLRVPAIGGNE